MISKRTMVASAAAVGAVLLTAAGWSATAAADDSAAADAPATAPPGTEWAHHGPRGPWHLYKQLDLTAEQQASIKAILTAARPQMKAVQEQLQADHQKLQQTKPDDANYGNVAAEVAQSQATLVSQRTTQESELRAQMYAVLTPAQKTQLAALEAQQAAKIAAWKAAHPGSRPE